MKDSFWFPIVFMLIIVIIFAGILSVMYRTSQPKIEAYQQEKYQKLILGTVAAKLAEVTGETQQSIMDSYPESYQIHVQELDIPGLERRAFRAVVADSTIAYCFEIGGKGLWGTMQALVSTSTDFRTILDMALVSQQETPGLGARIEEDWFLAQFRNRLFVINPESDTDVTGSYEFIAETQVPENDGQIKRVTGATITSDAVLKMLRDEMNHIYNYLRNKSL